MQALGAAGAGEALLSLARKVAPSASRRARSYREDAGTSGRPSCSWAPTRSPRLGRKECHYRGRGKSLVAAAAPGAEAQPGLKSEQLNAEPFASLHRDLQRSAVFGPLLQSILEWDADLCLVRQERNKTMTVRYALLTTLGESLCQNCAFDPAEFGPGLRPAAVFRAMLKGILTDAETEAFARYLCDVQRRECFDRVSNCQRQRVCLIWRGKPHPLSTSNPDSQLPLPTVFGLSWEDFCTRLAMPLADRPGLPG